ncbi:MAG: PEP-CTERM sorting domain-containing protein [Phycisphaerae bacterium]
MKHTTTLAAVALALALLAPVAWADWDETMGHKMHFPQYPDPNGWDVNISGYTVADDWQCSATGAVRDIHFWGSWAGDFVGNIMNLHVSIHGNVAEGPHGWSEPGDLLWARDFGPAEFSIALVGTGDQGWYNPGDAAGIRPDHVNYYQVNIVDIPDPFDQKKDTIYWLDLMVTVDAYDFGWKTSLDHWNDDAVYLGLLVNTGLNMNSVAEGWIELLDPITGESLDMAFVITPEPATLAFLGLGVAAMLARRHRRK